MTVGELKELLDNYPEAWEVFFSDENATQHLVDPDREPDGDQEWGELVVHITEKG